MDNKFRVYSTGVFSDKPQELIATFYNKDNAIDYTNYIATKNMQNYVILENGIEIYNADTT